MNADLSQQLATLSGLMAPVIVWRIRQRLAGKPKWTLPVLCAGLAVALSLLSQLTAAVLGDGEVSAWGVTFGTAMGGLGLLAREVYHQLESGERLPEPRTLGSYRRLDSPRKRREAPPGGSHGLVLTVALLLPLAGCGPSGESEAERHDRLCAEAGGAPTFDGLRASRGCVFPPQPCPCVEKFRPGSWVCPETVQLEEVPR